VTAEEVRRWNGEVMDNHQVAITMKGSNIEVARKGDRIDGFIPQHELDRIRVQGFKPWETVPDTRLRGTCHAEELIKHVREQQELPVTMQSNGRYAPSNEGDRVDAWLPRHEFDRVARISPTYGISPLQDSISNFAGLDSFSKDAYRQSMLNGSMRGIFPDKTKCYRCGEAVQNPKPWQSYCDVCTEIITPKLTPGDSFINIIDDPFLFTNPDYLDEYLNRRRQSINAPWWIARQASYTAVVVDGGYPHEEEGLFCLVCGGIAGACACCS
jgi:hypothetical protein